MRLICRLDFLSSCTFPRKSAFVDFRENIAGVCLRNDKIVLLSEAMMISTDRLNRNQDEH